MSSIAFLASLPAILALVGFVVFHVLKSRRAADPILVRIVEKLNADAPASAMRLEGLQARQIARLLERDQSLRQSVGEANIGLLRQVARQQHVQEIVVHCCIVVLFFLGLGGFLVVQLSPKVATMSGWSLRSTNPEANGLPVDTDTLELTWVAEGPAEDVTVCLENPQTGARSVDLRTRTSQQRIQFAREDYRNILLSRERAGSNRIRAVARTKNDAFYSAEFVLMVGIEIMILPVEDDKAVWVAALIDNSSINNYVFDGKGLVHRRDGQFDPFSFGDTFKNPKTIFPVAAFDEMDWATAKFAYFGPDDSRIVRTQLMR